LERRTIHRVVAASNNLHKLSEFRAAVGPEFQILSLEDIGCRDELPETTDTLEGNSRQKAAFVFEKYGLPCFSDDTGLEVYALGGAPGVYSARYAGEQKNSDDNIDLLLKNLKNIEDRRAQFRTVITLMGMGEPQMFEGIVTGVILHERRGTGGFGYDPIFLPDGYLKSLAEMTMDEKNAISHRGRAVKQLVAYLNRGISAF
jgi:XTP/dITP diphosphohydrolase